MLYRTLVDLGFEEKEAKLYLAALELGEGTVAQIAEKADVNRATTYFIAQALKQKGLLASSLKKKKKLLVAAGPEKLDELLDQRKSVLQKILPELRGLEKFGYARPKITYYEGERGIVTVYMDNLNAKGEILTIAGADTFHTVVLKHVPDYIQRRVMKKISLKMVVPDLPEMMRWRTQDISELRQTKLVPHEQFPFKVHIDIYNDKVAITSVIEKLGLIIQSQSVADTLRSFFGLTWSMMK